jgi:hypothetical protein
MNPCIHQFIDIRVICTIRNNDCYDPENCPDYEEDINTPPSLGGKEK